MPRTDAAFRVIAADPQTIFAALTDPDALEKWLPPSAMTGRFEHFDARPGGSYRLVLTHVDASSGRGKADEQSDIVEARFVDIVPDVCVVQAVKFVSNDPAYAGVMTMRWELIPVGGGTRLEIRAENVPPGITAEEHADGLNASLANLARYVER